jgi:hypothetical protein
MILKPRRKWTLRTGGQKGFVCEQAALRRPLIMISVGLTGLIVGKCPDDKAVRGRAPLVASQVCDSHNSSVLAALREFRVSNVHTRLATSSV